MLSVNGGAMTASSAKVKLTAARTVFNAKDPTPRKFYFHSSLDKQHDLPLALPAFN